MFSHARALVWPLWGRLILGEGGLWPVAVSLAWLERPEPNELFLRIVLYGVLLWNLYLFNDLTDMEADRSNPRKRQDVVEHYCRHKVAYWSVWASSSLVLPMVLHRMIGRPAGDLAVSVMAVNLLYSLKLKAVPWLDVAVVGLWGGLYAAVAMADLYLNAIVAAMTMIAHVYQTHVDRLADAARGIHTHAVKAPRAARPVIGVLACLMAVCVWRSGGSWLAIALSAAVAGPAARMTLQARAWQWSRLIFGFSWLLLLRQRVGL